MSESLESWHSFLKNRGAVWNDEVITQFNTTGTNPSASKLMIANHLAYFLIRGKDVIKFLQGQVTCDMNLLSIQHSVCGGHCNTKGRMVFSFRAIMLIDEAESKTVALIMDKGLIDTAANTLKKFAVFSKVEIIASQNHQLLALQGVQLEKIDAPNNVQIPQNINQCIIDEDKISVKISDERVLLFIPIENCKSIWESYSKTCTEYGALCWDLAEIADGFGHVRKETSEMFIPQMLNYQVFEGVSFKKGCYIGQEVVARMQYLGKLKRRMRRGLMATNKLLLPGTPLFTAESSQSIGNIVLAAPVDEAHCEILAVVTDDSSDSESLSNQDKTAKIIRWLPLPYAIPK
ncbi:CAF17-like 4Fe-4S cluster assembly/insertion protein YgfZ [Aurantivibrio infirmus]